MVLRDESFQDEEGLWHVYIRPDRGVERRGQFYDILNDIEEKCERDEHQNVMLVPVKPERTPASEGDA